MFTLLNTHMISIIVPLYNKEKTILRTLQRIQNQTYCDYEIIIVDDGSTDNSVEKVTSNTCDKRLRIIRQKNEGVSSARNRGAQEARGEWMVFLDADDYWLPSFLEEMAKAIEIYPNAKIIGCASYVFNETKKTLSTSRMIDRLYGKCLPLNFFLSPDIMSHIGASVIRRSAFLEIGGFLQGLKNNEDILLQGTLVMHGGYFYLGKMLHVYSIGVEGQATRNPSLKNKFMHDSLHVINEFYRLYQKQPDNNEVLQALCFRYRDFLIRYLKDSDYSSISYFLTEVEKGLRPHVKCGNWMRSHRLRKIAICYIASTKILWRLRGIQSRSHHSSHNKELQNIYKRTFL